ncbi:uncharacterized protein LOC128740205 [Sabethes cyaneus]|uniref:uncharacterized protein LOC128740205 n=1 Tax=Sabethes cyaneus TaxID=53552 RepID=UPI00237E5F1F|nr:uncharacterized protein LOC128740205 [Sabethes cyaneus]
MNLVTALCPSVEQTFSIIMYIFKWFGFIPFEIDSHNLKTFSCDYLRSPRYAYRWIIALGFFYAVLTAVTWVFHDDIFFKDFAIGWINDVLKYSSEVCAVFVALIEMAGVTNTQRNRQIVSNVLNLLFYLKNCYIEIWLMNMNVNMTLGWSNCFTLVSNFIHLASDIYWMYLVLLNKSIDGYGDLILGMCPFPIITVLLVYSAESCVAVVTSLEHLLHKMPEPADIELYCVLDRFSYCIKQQPIKFESHGLFEFNSRLLKTLITGFVTYMVMFIPFTSDIPEISDTDTGVLK